ncbi:cupin domain-containing protein [Candidatus Latescibacterota bacterium]
MPGIHNRYVIVICILFVSLTFTVFAGNAQAENSPKGFAFDNSENYTAYPGLHGGNGVVRYTEGFGADDFKSRYHFVRTGIIPPKSGIGEYRAMDAEEVFIIMSGSVFVTLNGNTALINNGNMIPCRIGEMIGLYNPTNEDVSFAWIAVTEKKGVYNPVDSGNDLSGKKQGLPCPFTSISFMGGDYDNPIKSAHGGKGPIYDTLGYIVHAHFTGKWSASPMILPPGTSIGYHRHDNHEEIFFVVTGSARATVDDVTLDQGPGDCTICPLGSAHGIYNNGPEDLHIIVSSLSAVPSGRRDAVDLGDDLTGR